MADETVTDDQPAVFTISKGSKALPDGMGQIKVGDTITVEATVQAIDDNGLTAEAVSVEAAPEPAPDGTEADADAGTDEAASTENPQADYVSGRRKKMAMAGTE